MRFRHFSRNDKKPTFKQPELTNNIKDNLQFISSIIMIPLKIQSKKYGVLSVIKRDKENFLTDLDFTHLKIFADFITLTIDNYTSYHEIIEKNK